MHSTLIDTLNQVDYPCVILANSPISRSELVEEELQKLILKAGNSQTVTLRVIPENVGIWDDSILDIIPDGNGLLVLNIQSIVEQEADSLHFLIAAQYTPDEVAKLLTTKNIGPRLHARCIMVNDRTEPLPRETESTDPSENTSLIPDHSVLEEVLRLDKNHCLFDTQHLAVYLFKGNEAPAILRLIGIARAITFAAIGAGSGQEIDLSKEDQYYDHVMLWDRDSQCLVGAYRIGVTEEIISALGADGLYLDHIFNFKKEYYEHLDRAMELSRSFILPRYQKNPQMLDALWKGVAQAAVSKDCYIMYGSVTISASFTPLSQAILIDTLDRYHSETPELRDCVSSSHPFKPQTKNHSLVSDAWADLGINRLNNVIVDIENNQRSIPPLIRYYIALGAKFLDFQVEKSFNNAIYCLLRVDLKALPKRYKRRLLGE